VTARALLQRAAPVVDGPHRHQAVRAGSGLDVEEAVLDLLAAPDRLMGVSIQREAVLATADLFRLLLMAGRTPGHGPPPP